MPLLDAPEIDQVRAVAGELAASLEASPLARDAGPQTQLDLATFYESAQRAGAIEVAGAAEARIELAIRRVLDYPFTSKLVGGWCGIGWMLANLLDDETADESCAGFDRELRDRVEVDEWLGDYDLLRGLAGIGQYALARRHTEDGRRILARVLDHLEATAERSAEGLAWLTRPELLAAREAFPRGRYDYGLAYGMPGVAGLLARLIDAGVEADRSYRLLDGCVSFLLGTVPPRRPSRFPAYVSPGQRDPPGARLSWCYGDAGVALALLSAARAARRADWEREAVALALQAAARSSATAGVVDAGVCRGAAGLGHAFHRLYLAVGDARLRDAARSWLRIALEHRVAGAGLAGYRTWYAAAGEAPGWHDDASLLNGAPGTALALLAAAFDVEPDWDAMLMFDVAPRP
jgi:lantibiotic biosynthesis protein